MKNKILTLLGFASKAGKLSFGFNASSQAANSKKSRLIVIASDVSEKSKKEIRFLSGKEDVSVSELEDITQTELSNAVGRSCGIISINDNSFASAVAEESGRKC